MPPGYRTPDTGSSLIKPHNAAMQNIGNNNRHHGFLNAQKCVIFIAPHDNKRSAKMNETPYRFEPAYLDGDIPPKLVDLATSLAQESARLPGRLPDPAAAELADLVRIMNCYYSNLIEGHKTKPIDIEKALAAPQLAARPLLQEARAHIAVQKHVDSLFYNEQLPLPTSDPFIRDIHKRFYEAMPEEFRTLESDSSKLRIVPGAFRTRAEENVKVGLHIPPASERVIDFMTAYGSRFALADRQPGQRILSIPAAHHRLNYIHPFVDGNGRVSRLVSHAMALRAGIGANGLWSISRGLARGINDPNEYKMMMNAADTPRQGDRDGRGNLSQSALIQFSEWFLRVALDQVTFSAKLFDLDTLADRYTHLCDIVFPGTKHPGKLIAKVLELGELSRGSVPIVLGLPERTARNILAATISRGFLKSDTPKGAIRVAFPLQDKAYLFPGLFAEDPDIGKPAPYIARNNGRGGMND